MKPIMKTIYKYSNNESVLSHMKLNKVITLDNLFYDLHIAK